MFSFLSEMEGILNTVFLIASVVFHCSLFVLLPFCPFTGAASAG